LGDVVVEDEADVEHKEDDIRDDDVGCVQ